jgi:CheY-like chemotaxis protein
MGTSMQITAHPWGFGAGSPRILLADDDAVLRGFLAEELREGGAEVVEVANGREALETVQASLADSSHRWFDLIVADFKMPELSGLQLLNSLRHEGLPTPFILVTGFRSTALQDQAEELGAWAVLQKPVDMKALHWAVRDAV